MTKMNQSEDRPEEGRDVSVPETDDASRDLPLLLEIAQATSLREGGEGVRTALWELYWLEPRSTREWARSVRLVDNQYLNHSGRGELSPRQRHGKWLGQLYQRCPKH